MRSDKNIERPVGVCVCHSREMEHSHVGQSGAEVLVNVRFEDRIKVLELDVANQRDYEHLSKKPDRYVRILTRDIHLEMIN